MALAVPRGRFGAVGLRPTERPRDEIQNKLGDPRAAWSTEIGRAASGVKVLNCHGERRGHRMGRSLAGKPDDIQSEIGRVKPETNSLGRKCGLVSPGDRVITWIATKNRLSRVFEATMDRTLV